MLAMQMIFHFAANRNAGGDAEPHLSCISADDMAVDTGSILAP